MQLSDEQQRLLRAIMNENSPCRKRDAATRADLSTMRASVLLHEMEEGDPPLVESAVDNVTYEEAWIVTVAGADALEASGTSPGT
jgi:hypothetical protein